MSLYTLCNTLRARALFDDRNNELTWLTWLTWVRAADYCLSLKHPGKAITLLKYSFELAELTLSCSQCNQQLVISRLTYSALKLAQVYQAIGDTHARVSIIGKTKKRLSSELPSPGISTWILGCMRQLSVSTIDSPSVSFLKQACLSCEHKAFCCHSK